MNERLEQLRWSLVELSQRTGESYRNVHRWMREDVKVPGHFVARFVEVVPVSATWLLSGRGSPDPVTPGAAEIALDRIAAIVAPLRMRTGPGFLAEQVVQGSEDGIMAFDPAFCYTLWNPAMVRFTGRAPGEVLGRSAFETFPFLEETGERLNFEAVLAGESVVTEPRPFRLRRQGWYQAHYSPLRDDSGRVVGGIGVVRDVTAWQEALERLRETEERFLLKMGHDPILTRPERETVY